MIRILFVCLGNICRSPLAEGVFRKHVEDMNLQHLITCDSAGMISYHAGSLPDPRTRKNATSHGIELTHRARAFSEKDPDEFDFILAMDSSNLSEILRYAGKNPKATIMLMREFDTVHDHGEVPDPYYGDDEHFEEVFQILHRSSGNFLQHLIKEKISGK